MGRFSISRSLATSSAGSCKVSGASDCARLIEGCSKHTIPPTLNTKTSRLHDLQTCVILLALGGFMAQLTSNSTWRLPTRPALSSICMSNLCLPLGKAASCT